jgi:hypothetical protein
MDLEKQKEVLGFRRSQCHCVGLVVTIPTIILFFKKWTQYGEVITI